MRGTIEARKDGEARDGSPYAMYTIDGQKYSTFKFLDFQVGDEIDFMWQKSKDGKYKNLTSAEPAMPEVDKNDFIIREVAIKAAAVPFQGMVVDHSTDILDIAHQVIKIAKEFEAYIKGDGEEPVPEDDIPF